MDREAVPRGRGLQRGEILLRACWSPCKRGGRCESVPQQDQSGEGPTDRIPLEHSAVSLSMTNEELIRNAASVPKRHTTADGRLFGDVGATFLTDRHNAYSGVCIDTGSGTGWCAEHSAIAAMVTRISA